MGLAGWVFRNERRYALAQRLAAPPTRLRSHDRLAPQAAVPPVGLGADARPEVADAGELPRLVEAAVSDSRTELLDRVRRAIDGAAAQTPAARYRREGSLDAESRTQLFCERVGDYRADGAARIDVSDIETAVGGICAERDVRRLAIPPQLTCGPPASTSSKTTG